VATRNRRFVLSADDPVSAAKITAQDVPERAAQRPRITKLIAEGVRWYRLTIVTGPLGAGKTTALALWAVTEPGIVAWPCRGVADRHARAFPVPGLGDASLRTPGRRAGMVAGQLRRTRPLIVR
jgi:hypothetical protein